MGAEADDSPLHKAANKVRNGLKGQAPGRNPGPYWKPTPAKEVGQAVEEFLEHFDNQQQKTREEHDWKKGQRIGEASNPGPSRVRSLWRQKRHLPGTKERAQQAVSSPPYHKKGQQVQAKHQNSDPWRGFVPRGTGNTFSSPSLRDSLAPYYDGRQDRMPRWPAGPKAKESFTTRISAGIHSTWREEIRKVMTRWACRYGSACHRRDCRFFHGSMQGQEAVLEAWESAGKQVQDEPLLPFPVR